MISRSRDSINDFQPEVQSQFSDTSHLQIYYPLSTKPIKKTPSFKTTLIFSVIKFFIFFYILMILIIDADFLLQQWYLIVFMF